MSDSNIRLSAPALRVLGLFVQEPRRSRSGADITRQAQVGSGTLYPILSRLEEAGWFTSEWEKIDPAVQGRPRRRYYTITALGQNCAHMALAPMQIHGAPAWNI